MKFNKTETEYNMKSIRFLLLTITTMFIIIAGLMIVLGFSVYSHYHTFSFFYESANSGRLFTPSLLCILLGMFLLIVTLFGFFGSIKQSTCMVNLYALILGIMLILKLVVIILAFTLDTGAIRAILYIPVSQYASDPEIEMEIDRLQVSLNCCGSDSLFDYEGMEFTGNHSTTVVSTTINGNSVMIVVPETCCITPGVDICVRMRERSCKTALVNLFSQNASVIGVLGISVMFIQLLGIIFALLLARCIRKVKSERGLMSWRIKEQTILARQSEETKKQDATTDDRVYIPPHESSTA
ncbi:CD151 antigen-like isoform X1 [Pararge aegeria]|uniref:CD151 antigen-like isoform X1 n=2 Tax=Pararge aegeria TaxID=116150 RepID=UPI0019D20D08|nr:CD151 antigen-like isoform X1 [Pararge aegeria]XP_039747246.1 CD151 antigen-like isoform X1 [Pararge aegeria]XP_039747248.1 CD151 antigen-like isoform X1 [Pararge aegeria]XP_039747249.1 CD151 antigen-like isoform X1 [Pararge aegeria]XP_039747250.1 CD151 antigen-like isoform X1 [Pararge aegeria]